MRDLIMLKYLRRVVSAKDYLRLMKSSGSENVAAARIVPPRLGDNRLGSGSFGSLEVEFKTPVFAHAMSRERFPNGR